MDDESRQALRMNREGAAGKQTEEPTGQGFSRRKKRQFDISANVLILEGS
jgi:hypothetical protein